MSRSALIIASLCIACVQIQHSEDILYEALYFLIAIISLTRIPTAWCCCACISYVLKLTPLQSASLFGISLQSMGSGTERTYTWPLRLLVILNGLTRHALAYFLRHVVTLIGCQHARA